MNRSEDAESGVLEGAISVSAALRSGNREIHVVLLDESRDPRETASLERVARETGKTLERVPRVAIDERASGKRHGGVIAVVGPRRYLPAVDLVSATSVPFIVMIDGVEDPYNFGAAVRSLYAAGADGLVMRPRNWMSSAGIVARASAGTTEMIPMSVAESAMEAADIFEQHGLAIACADPDDGLSIFQADLTVPLFLLVGGEQRGVTRSFLRRATLRLRIPYGRFGRFSLGTAASAAVIGFEVMRQRSLR